ncbi:metabotropic glutamate receptor 4 isoform X1 [Nematostella vectensis]|uniref:metabotropic glutamate receptor 4 isoform X1 n=2 Tax=Nematostella vectensis TaxID=45351 RepID=UPI00207717AC|nr:metabotropic glutamate receptor 4 isoform X1 [Nematostella vectensis]
MSIRLSVMGHQLAACCVLMSALAMKGCVGATSLDIPGDVIIGGLFPVHLKNQKSENSCGPISTQPGFQYLAAMLFALELINNSSTLLRNITLGASIYDTCQSQTIGADHAKDIIKESLLTNNKLLKGVVGPLVSDVSIATVQLLRVFGLPQVSFGSTSPDLSNKDLYGSFFRTVPPDSFQAEALVDILEHHGWNYIITINSAGNYGENGMSAIIKITEKRDICIAATFTVPPLSTDAHYERIIREIAQARFDAVNIIVVFTTQTDSAGLLSAAARLGATRFTWLGSNGWSNRMTVTIGNEMVANGSITVNHMDGQVAGFEEFFSSMNPINNQNIPWIDEFWENWFKCDLPGGKPTFYKNCTEDLVLPKMEVAPVRVVINAVYAFAHALDDMQRALCPGKVGLCEAMIADSSGKTLIDFLRNVTFPDASYGWPVRFNKNQEMDGNYSIMNFQYQNGKWIYENVGSWSWGDESDNVRMEHLILESQKISWGKGKLSPPHSICSAPCQFPQIRNQLPVNPKCCWECSFCDEHQIVVNDSCQSCLPGHRPYTNHSMCVKLPVVHPSLGEAMGITFAVWSCLGMLVTLAICVFFVKSREHEVVKAAGRELCAIILLGIMLCYASIFTNLVEPDAITCTVERFFSSVCYTTCYAPLLMKTNRIYRIFSRARKAASRPHLTSPTSQVLVTAGLIAVQLLLTTVWTISSPSHIHITYERLTRTVISCESHGGMLALNLSYNILLMLVCTLFAFKTRNFPRNFNEAKYIGVMMYLTCAAWIIYLPSYLNTHDVWAHVYLNCGVSVTIATITLAGIFAPKVHVIISGDRKVGDVAQKRQFATLQTRTPVLEARSALCVGDSSMLYVSDR